jgi:lysophospholipase L1-like esterase
MFAACRDGFEFIDINPVFFTPAGVARDEFYLEDRLHLTPAAYAALEAYLEPRLAALLAGR